MYPDASSTEQRATHRVLVVGMGALGCPAAELLAAAGDVRLTLVDHDRVELSNLQRQILFDDDDLGRPKVAAAAAALTRGHPGVEVDTLAVRVDAYNAAALAARHDFVIDACDDPTTKLLLNDACLETGTPLAYGGVMRTGGQTMTILPGRSACLACAFPDLDTNADVGACSRMGILAPVAGVVGSLQALAALQTLSGRPDPGRMRIYELRGARWRTVRFERLADCPACAGPRGTRETDRSRRRVTCPT